MKQRWWLAFVVPGLAVAAWGSRVTLAAGQSATPAPAAADKPSFDVPDFGACHQDQVRSIGQTRHGSVAQSCQHCHGDPSAHLKGALEGEPGPIQKFKSLTPKQSAAVCEDCHNKAGQKHWTSSTHASRGVVCTTCH